MAYTRPAGDEADLRVSGKAIARSSGAHADFSSGYLRQHGSDANFVFQGAAYTRPDGDAADFGQAVVTDVLVTGAAVLGAITASGTVAHGITVAGAATLGPVTAEGMVEITDPAVVVVGAGVLGAITAAGVVSHGINVAGSAALGAVVADGQVAHGIAVAGAATLGPVTALGGMAHGISVAGAATLAPIAAAGDVLHPRYVLKGEVRDSGVLVNRLVRAYRLDTGALVGEQVTTAGRFDIHAGFAEREHYILPLDMSDGATDWLPPTANHVLSELAVD